MKARSAADALLGGRSARALWRAPWRFAEVLAVVPALGNGKVLAALLLDPGPETPDQPIDLDPGVVDVELAGDLVSGPFEQGRDPIAERRSPAVADVEWSGRVGRDELDVDPAPHGGPPPVGRPFGENPLDLGRQRIAGEPDVDEAGAGDLGPGHDIGRERQHRHDPLRQRPGVAPERLGEGHGQVGGKIPVSGISGTLDHEGGIGHAQLRGDPRELGPDLVAHSAGFFPDAAGAAVSLAGVVSLAGSGLAEWSSCFRGPLPSFP
jgi:hypothetical protein